MWGWVWKELQKNKKSAASSQQLRLGRTGICKIILHYTIGVTSRKRWKTDRKTFTLVTWIEETIGNWKCMYRQVRYLGFSEFLNFISSRHQIPGIAHQPYFCIYSTARSGSFFTYKNVALKYKYGATFMLSSIIRFFLYTCRKNCQLSYLCGYHVKMSITWRGRRLHCRWKKSQHRGWLGEEENEAFLRTIISTLFLSLISIEMNKKPE